MPPLKRSKKTDLTDNELILFDAIFDGDCSFEMLTKDNIREYGHLPYAHDLDDDALQALLTELVDKGLLRTFVYAYADDTDDTDYYGLTQKGGDLWEAERNPDWERYIYTRQYFEDDLRIWAVESVSLNAAQNYLQVAREGGFGAPDEVTLVRKPNHLFLPWKTFPLVFELYGEASEDLSFAMPLKWWRTIPDLLRG